MKLDVNKPREQRGRWFSPSAALDVSFKHGYSLEVEFAISVIQCVLRLVHTKVERSGSGVELRVRILAAVLKPSASFFHSTLLQFTQLNK